MKLNMDEYIPNERIRTELGCYYVGIESHPKSDRLFVYVFTTKKAMESVYRGSKAMHRTEQGWDMVTRKVDGIMLTSFIDGIYKDRFIGKQFNSPMFY